MCAPTSSRSCQIAAGCRTRVRAARRSRSGTWPQAMFALALPVLGHPLHPSSDAQGMVPVPRARPSMHVPPVCKDLDSECLEAAARGACKTAAEFMLTNCRLSAHPPTTHLCLYRHRHRHRHRHVHRHRHRHRHLLQVVLRSLLDGRDGVDVPFPEGAVGAI